jgi:ribosomal-protein-serine acetyltransferase
MQNELRVDDHLHLRAWTFRDAPVLQALIVANMDHLSAWLPWPEERSSRKAVEDYIQHVRFSAHSGGNCFYGIWENDVLVGEIARTSNNERNRYCSMSYWLDASAQGRGIVFRSAKRLLEHQFRDLDMNRVEIRVATGNGRSRAVVEKLGFRREGLLRQIEWIGDRFMDHEVFSLLRNEWKEMQRSGEMDAGQ